jgi:hypothetical protein
MPKTKEQVQGLIAALHDAGYEPRSYSGRGMNGKQCVGVSATSAFGIGAALEDITAPEPCQDQLGKRYIFYWPAYEWPGVYDGPCAADGLLSYRYPSAYGGWIMIGALDKAQALSEARRSTDSEVSLAKLETWSETDKQYVAVTSTDK